MKKYIFVRTQFEAFHYWKDAPEQVAFLRNPHRHIFHVQIDLEVKSNDRELEFFIVKSQIDQYIKRNMEGSYSQNSCEQFAEFIFLRFRDILPIVKVEVSEDGENGAYITNYSIEEEFIPKEHFTF